MGVESKHMTLRAAASAALVVTVVLGMLNNLLFLWAFEFRTDWFIDPAQLVGAGPASAGLLRWAALTDLLSYYLPTAVVALALWHVLRSRSPALADGATLGALGYALAGSIAAVALARAGPLLLEATAVPGADQASIAASIAAAFALLMEVVWHGVWQLLDTILIGAWLIGVGLFDAGRPAGVRTALDHPRRVRLVGNRVQPARAKHRALCGPRPVFRVVGNMVDLADPTAEAGTRAVRHPCLNQALEVEQSCLCGPLRPRGRRLNANDRCRCLASGAAGTDQHEHAASRGESSRLCQGRTSRTAIDGGGIFGCALPEAVRRNAYFPSTKVTLKTFPQHPTLNASSLTARELTFRASRASRRHSRDQATPTPV